MGEKKNLFTPIKKNFVFGGIFFSNKIWFLGSWVHHKITFDHLFFWSLFFNRLLFFNHPVFCLITFFFFKSPVFSCNHSVFSSVIFLNRTKNEIFRSVKKKIAEQKTGCSKKKRLNKKKEGVKKEVIKKWAIKSDFVVYPTT